jgi:hypothetical protein
MIPIDKLHNYLNKGGPDVAKDYVFHIPEKVIAEGHIYDKYILDAKYSFVDKEIVDVPEWTGLDSSFKMIKDRNNERKNSFIYSVLNEVLGEFRYLDVKSKVIMIKDLMRQIAYDMEEKSLYRDNDYTRKRTLIREKFMANEDIDDDAVLKGIIVDYFSLTVYVFREVVGGLVKRRKVERISYIPSMWKNDDRKMEYVLKNPSCFLIEKEGRYYPVFKSDMTGVMSWESMGIEFFEELRSGGAVAQPKQETKLLKKMTLVELQKVAIDRGVSIFKKSEKTGKDLKKSISELREELENM